ncbi:cysteine desulfurase NifS [Acidobacteriota bacterium]
MKPIYLDNNATTRVAEEVRDAMLPYFCDLYGNPSSMHSFGGQVEAQLEEARAKVASVIGASSPSEIVFTSCGTESDNAAIRGVLDAMPNKRHVITTRVEHPAVNNLAKFLSRRGYAVTELPVDQQGMIDPDQLKDEIRDDTAIVSIMYANNETGTIFPIEKISQIVKEYGIIFHTDAVQAVGKLPLDMSRGTIDLLALSGHKLHAPKGIGALYIKRGTRFNPFIIGGHQERGRRGGTENIPYIIGLGVAIELAEKHLEEENQRVRSMRDRLESIILKEIPSTRLNGHPIHRLPNTANISFEFVEGEAILLMLDQYGIAASSGSACTSGSLEPSHVLRAMGIPFTYAHGSIRFSFSRYNTDEDVDTVLEVLPGIISKLRDISPFTPKAGA